MEVTVFLRLPAVQYGYVWQQQLGQVVGYRRGVGYFCGGAWLIFLTLSSKGSAGDIVSTVALERKAESPLFEPPENLVPDVVFRLDPDGSFSWEAPIWIGAEPIQTVVTPEALRPLFRRALLREAGTSQVA